MQTLTVCALQQRSHIRERQGEITKSLHILGSRVFAMFRREERVKHLVEIAASMQG